jgi:hypothetical protein
MAKAGGVIATIGAPADDDLRLHVVVLRLLVGGYRLRLVLVGIEPQLGVLVL